jgi:hypothetical protein
LRAPFPNTSEHVPVNPGFLLSICICGYRREPAGYGYPKLRHQADPVPAPTSQAETDPVFPGIHLVELLKIRKVGSVSDDPWSDYGVSIHYGILDAVNSKW